MNQLSFCAGAILRRGTVSANTSTPLAPCVRVTDDGPVRVITLARSQRHNALVPDLIDGIRAAIQSASTIQAIRAVVIAAEGANFSTGGDVAEFAARSGNERLDYAREIVGGLNDMMLELIRLDVPVIAAVRGMVTGGSIGLVLASDVVLLDANATFAPYYVDVGFSPDGGWTALLPDRIGQARAMSVQLSNSVIDAPKAVSWGLATDIVPGDVTDAAVALAHTLATKKTATIRRTKRLLWGDLTVIEARLRAELESFVDEIGTDDATAGMAAFLEHRNPRSSETDGSPGSVTGRSAREE